MKRVAAKSAENGLAVAPRMAESCANGIDGFPPRKSSAERRIRATSPKPRVDDAGEGSLISPEPVGAASSVGGPLPPAAPSFRGKVKTVNQWVSNRLLRKLVRPPAEPGSLASGR